MLYFDKDKNNRFTISRLIGICGIIRMRIAISSHNSYPPLRKLCKLATSAEYHKLINISDQPMTHHSRPHSVAGGREWRGGRSNSVRHSNLRIIGLALRDCLRIDLKLPLMLLILCGLL